MASRYQPDTHAQHSQGGGRFDQRSFYGYRRIESASSLFVQVVHAALHQLLHHEQLHEHRPVLD
jgi:hypothetical protein